MCGYNFAPLSGRLVGSRGPRLPLLVAGSAMATGGWMLTTLGTRTATSWLVAAYLVFGIGFGMVNAPITNTAVSGLPRSRAGVAAALASTSRQVGQSLGVAVIGSAVIAGLRGPLPTGFAVASHRGWWIISGCGAAILAIGVLSTGRRHDGDTTAVAAGPAAGEATIAVGTPWQEPPTLSPPPASGVASARSCSTTTTAEGRCARRSA